MVLRNAVESAAQTRPLSPMDEAIGHYDDSLSALFAALSALKDKLDSGGVLAPETTSREKTSKGVDPIPVTARLVEQIWVRSNNVSELASSVRELTERLAV